MRLYLNERPRTLIIVSNNYALIIRHPFPTYKNSNHHHIHHHHIHLHHHHGSTSGKGVDSKGRLSSNKVIVEFVRKDMLKLGNYKDITPNKSKLNRQLLGFLGLLNVNNNIHLGFITGQTKIASPMIGEDIQRITGVDFYCLNNDEYDYLINRSVINEEDIQNLHLQSPQYDPEKVSSGYPAASVRKLLELGAFYYSKDFDITSNVQERGFRDINDPTFTLMADSPYFKRFMWNSYMISEFIEFRNRLSPPDRLQFDLTGFLTTITRGFAQTVNTCITPNEEALLTIISKQSCMKNGPLFGDWGVDDKGDVSNFVETEMIIYTKKICFSYVLVRGNVPTFWELENPNKKSLLSSKKNKKISTPRSFEASQHAFVRHFDKLVNQFSEVHIVNLLSSDGYKGELNHNYKEHIDYFNRNIKNNSSSANGKMSLNYKLPCTDLPINVATIKKYGYTPSNPRNISDILVDSIIDYGALFYDKSKKNFTGRQLGVFRINSFDSLKKANFISKIISQEVIELAFRDTGIAVDPDIFIKHAKLWSENDEYLSKITSSYISNSSKLQASSRASTKSSVKSHLSKKYLSSVVSTKPSEMAMLKLLGHLQDQVDIKLHNPIHDYVTRELNKRAKEFSSYEDISIYASTFNVNGLCYEGDISEWLFPKKENITTNYDVVFIGFQEVTELTAGKMVTTDSSNRNFWERKIKSALEECNPNHNKYVSLWCGQIGSIAIFLFINQNKIENVSNVEGSFKKTGFGGMGANKGAVAVSFNYANSEICLVASHLAAGLSNTDERHQNYKSIAKGIKFSKNRRIRDHDAVIWLGDFNYRVGLTNEQVRPLIEQKEFSKLFEYDQLNKQMANGESFPFFDEMEITFPPTYKFDNGTKNYDTSEKQRIPAWTDRILSLSRNKIIKQLSYDSSPDLIFSDHRPVHATFTMSVNVIDETIKKNLSHDLYENYRKSIGDINESLITSNNLTLFDAEFDDKVLPAPSSDVMKWWLESGKPAKISIPELNSDNFHDGTVNIINPKLPHNPFMKTDEPEFISKKSLLNLLK